MSSFSISEYHFFMTSIELRSLFSQNIKKYRKLNGMTQMVLAEKADLSVGYLCDLEAGNKWGMPETITKLSNALNIKPYQLFLDDEEKTTLSISDDLLELSSELKKTIDYDVNALIRKYMEK